MLVNVQYTDLACGTKTTMKTKKVILNQYINIYVTDILFSRQRSCIEVISTTV